MVQGLDENRIINGLCRLRCAWPDIAYTFDFANVYHAEDGSWFCGGSCITYRVNDPVDFL
jgi:hypothetical protein